MTGFGKVTAELPSKKVTVEIKALKRNANTQFVTPVA